MENLQSADPSAVGVFRVNGTTTASVNDAGEVTIRQVRKVAVAPLPGEPRSKVPVETLEVVVKLAAVDFAKVGRMVGALHGE